MESGREIRTLEGHSDRVMSVALSEDERRAASISADNTVKVRELEAGSAVAAFTCDGPVQCCAFINDRKVIAGDAGGWVYVLRLEEPKAKN